MTGKGSTRDFAELSKASARHLRAGLMVEYMRDLRQMSEILNLSDRILVMHEGALKGELFYQDATQDKILSLASGLA